MTEETTITPNPADAARISDKFLPATDSARNGDSHIFKVSIRAWIALILVATVCVMAFMQRIVEEPLYSLATLAIGFYFGQKVPTPNK